MTKLEELKAALEAAKAPGYRKEEFDEAFAKFTDKAFVLMPTLLEAVEKLQDMAQLAFDATQYDEDDEDDEVKVQDMARIQAALDLLKELK